jgi:hypothetical protein
LQLTPHQAKYIAHDLTLQHAGGGLDRLSQALFNASVDLNPHQIEAAVFTLRSLEGSQNHKANFFIDHPKNTPEGEEN